MCKTYYAKSILISAILLFIACDVQKKNEIKEGKLPVNGIEIYYKIMGSGEPTFILHGGPGDTHDTMLQLKDLADEFKLVFYDQRAAGRSTGDEDTASHAVSNFVDDLEQMRLKMSFDKINIIGGSWGAMLAMQYAFKYSKNISSLVLMSSIGYKAECFKDYQANVVKNRAPEDSTELERIYVTDAFRNRNPEAMEKFWRTYFRAYFYNPDLVDNLNLWYRDSTYNVVKGRYAKLGKFFKDYNILEDLKLISCPTLILYGDYDATPIEYITPIHKNIQGSQMITIKNAGHWLWVEAPDRVIPIVRNFLKTHK